VTQFSKASLKDAGSDPEMYEGLSDKSMIDSESESSESELEMRLLEACGGVRLWMAFLTALGSWSLVDLEPSSTSELESRLGADGETKSGECAGSGAESGAECAGATKTGGRTGVDCLAAWPDAFRQSSRLRRAFLPSRCCSAGRDESNSLRRTCGDAGGGVKGEEELKGVLMPGCCRR
jgi:hypothetical protein